MEKNVINRQATIVKSLIITCRLAKAVESEQSPAALMSSKSTIKLRNFK